MASLVKAELSTAEVLLGSEVMLVIELTLGVELPDEVELCPLVIALVVLRSAVVISLGLGVED